ncbi:acyl carrier protein, partial [Streptomyces sp. NPDC002134]
MDLVHVVQRAASTALIWQGTQLMGNSYDVLTTDPGDSLATLAECEQRFAGVLADIVGTDHVSVDSHFFDDLGADSMLMARFCARVRKQADLPSVSMP